MACPGSANLEVSIPGFVEPVRDDMAGAKGVGTRLHETLEPFHDWSPDFLMVVGEVVLEFSAIHWRKRRPMCDDSDKMDEWLLKSMGVVIDNAGRILSEWMRELREYPPQLLQFVSQAAYYMGDLIGKRQGSLLLAEAHLTADWLDSKPGTTPDVLIKSNKRLDVIDYKSGKIPVSPVDNYQLLFYAACVIHRQPLIEEVVLHILQPGNLDYWETTADYVRHWMAKARATDRLIIEGSTQLRPSDYCTFCPANPHSRADKGNIFCPAMMERLYPSVADEDAILNL